MSELSYLEKLLDGAEVEWLPLSDVCRFINGRAYKQEELLPQGKYPVLRVGNFFTNQNWYYSDLELEQDKYCDKGDLLYAWSASFGPRIWGEGKSIYHYHIWKVVPDTSFICKQFLYYLLQWDVKALKDAHSTGSTMMHVSKSAIEKRTVPIPCPNNPEKSLAIQSEIVRILDKFTALTAELTAELTARKKQYNYYRDQLLSFNDGASPYLGKLLDGAEVEWLALGKVCDFKNGFAFKSNLFKETGLPIVRITNIDGVNVVLDEVKYFSPSDYKEDISSFEVLMGDILIAMSGATTGKVGFYKGETKCYLNQRVGKFMPKSNILNNKFLYHFLLLNTGAIYTFAGGGAQPNLSSNALMSKLLIPIPCPNNPEKSLAIQSEIVRILDKFYSLTNSITEGLPREIELRQQQYEYYRDLLFSFPKPEAVTE